MISVERRVTPGLAFRFEALPATLAEAVAQYLPDGVAGSARRGRVVTVSASPPPASEVAGAAVLEQDGVTVHRAGEVTRFEAAGIVGWCRGGSGGVVAGRPTAESARQFVGLALAPLLIELAEPLGWLGLHAAAVAEGGRGILLPGPSGAGKSTTFRHCADAGLEVLSDDLVWLAEEADGFRAHPFARGFPAGSAAAAVPPPSVESARLAAIVCPAIRPRESSRLVFLPSAAALDVLLAESGFLGPPPATGRRFRALVRLAGSLPCRLLEAGRRPADVPPLLRRLVAELEPAAG